MSSRPPTWYVNNLPCPECNEPHPRCVAHTTTGRACASRPLEGGFRCNTHTSTRDAPEITVKMADEVDMMAAIGPLLRQCSVVTRGRTYIESLEDALNRANSNVLLYSLLVETLRPKAQYVTGVVAADTPRERTTYDVTAEGLVGPDHEGNLVVHPWMTQYREWVDVQAKLAKVAYDLGLTERQVEVQEAQVKIMSTTLRTILTELNIDLADPATRAVLERNLMAMQSAQVQMGGILTASATAS